MKFTQTSTPAIKRFEYRDENDKDIGEWKVSPHTGDCYDEGAVWCDTREEALEVAQEMLDEHKAASHVD